MGKKKVKCPECAAGEKWAVPTADFYSLLLALFIALYSIAAVNTSKQKALKEEFVKIFDYAPQPQMAVPVMKLKPDPGNKKSSSQTESQQSESVTKSDFDNKSTMIQEGGVLEQTDNSMHLKLPSSINFAKNSYLIDNQDTLLYIRRMASIIKSMPKTVNVNIIGYSDDKPVQAPFTSHYQLAAARALNVLEQLIKYGVDKKRLSFTSYGDNVSNGAHTTDNRVEIYFRSNEEDISSVQSILDKAKILNK